MAKKKKKTAEDLLCDRLDEIVTARKMSSNEFKRAFNTDVSVMLIEAVATGKAFIIRFDSGPGIMRVGVLD